MCKVCGKRLEPKVGPGRPREYCDGCGDKFGRYYWKNREKKLAVMAEWRARNPPAGVRACARCGGVATSRRHRYCDECRRVILAKRRETERGRKRAEERLRDRGTTTERGYGARHQHERKRVARIVEAGAAVCAQCGQPITPGSKWMLGHDHYAGGYLGPEHYRCGIRERNVRHRTMRVLASREW